MIVYWYMYDSCSSTRSLWKVFFRFECHSTFSRCCVTRKKEEVLVFLKKSIIHQCKFSLLLTDLQVIWGVEGLASRWSLLRCWSEFVAAPSHIWMNRDCWWSPGNCVGRCSSAGGGGEAICLDWKNLDVGLFKMDWKKFEYINLALDNTLLYQLDVRLTKMLVAVLQGFLISQPYSTLNVVHFILYVIVETTHKQIFNIFTVAMLNRNL